MKKFACFIIWLLFMIMSGPVSAQWVKLTGPEGGYFFDLERAGHEIWAGAWDGCYKSSDEGYTWTNLGLFNGRCYRVFSSNDSIYLIYGEYNNTQPGNFYYDHYMTSSFDDGLHWSQPVLIETFSEVIDQAVKIGSTFIIVGKGYHISHDLGISWSSFDLPFGDHINRICSDGKTILLNTKIAANNCCPESFISTDGALSWQHINAPYYIYDFYVHDSTVLLSVIDTTYSWQKFYMLRSQNLGATWDTVFSGSTGQFFASFRNIDGLLCISTWNNNLLISNDDGRSWDSIPYDSLPFSSNVITLQNGDKLGLGEYGIKRFSSSANAYIPANNGIAGLTIDYLASNNNVLFASSYHQMFRSLDAGNTWQEVNFPYYSVIDMAFKGDTVFCTADSYLLRSFDNGVTWDTVAHPSFFYAGTGDMGSVEFKNNRLFFAGEAMFYSDDFGTTWNNLPNFPNYVVNPCYDNFRVFGNLKVFENELYSVSSDGFIFKFDTINNIWQYLTCFWSTGAHTNNGLYQLDSSLVVCGAGFKYSNDHGQTWITPAVHGMNYLPLSVVSISGLWFCVSDIDGICVSADHGENWQPLHSGVLPFFPNGGLTVMNNCLYSGSYLSSVWRRLGTFNPISGLVYNDSNNNGIRDSTENVLPGMIIHTNPSSWVTTSNSSGIYSYQTDMTGDTLSVVKPCPYAISLPNYFITNGQADNQDFGIFIDPGINDFAIDLSNVNVFRPGFQTELILSAKNYGALKRPAQIQLTLDTNISFVNSVYPPFSVTGNTYTWLTDSLSFLESQRISVIVETNLSAQLNQTVTCHSIIFPVIHDTVPQNNYSNISAVIVSSYDPNEKECQQGEFLTRQQIMSGEEFIYTIRFQNTGNVQTEFIHVKDTLSNYFDMSTFRLIASSHPLTWSLSNNNLVDFFFQNIHLTPSSTDEINSQGFVKFGIKCKRNLNVGNALTNKSFIFFDYNAAIETNTTVTLIINPIHVGIPENFSQQNKGFTINVYPNPTSNDLYFDMGKLTEIHPDLIILNSTGSVVMKEKLLSDTPVLHMKDCPDGVYFGLLIIPENGKRFSFKFILKK